MNLFLFLFYVYRWLIDSFLDSYSISLDVKTVNWLILKHIFTQKIMIDQLV